MTVASILSGFSISTAVRLVVTEMSTSPLHVEQELISGIKTDAAITAHNNDDVSYYTYFVNDDELMIVTGE